MGRADLIGPGKHQLVPNWQPAGTGVKSEGRGTERECRRKCLTKGQRNGKARKFLTVGVFPGVPRAIWHKPAGACALPARKRTTAPARLTVQSGLPTFGFIPFH